MSITDYSPDNGDSWNCFVAKQLMPSFVTFVWGLSGKVKFSRRFSAISRFEEFVKTHDHISDWSWELDGFSFLNPVKSAADGVMNEHEWNYMVPGWPAEIGDADKIDDYMQMASSYFLYENALNAIEQGFKLLYKVCVLANRDGFECENPKCKNKHKDIVDCLSERCRRSFRHDLSKVYYELTHRIHSVDGHPVDCTVKDFLAYRWHEILRSNAFGPPHDHECAYYEGSNSDIRLVKIDSKTECLQRWLKNKIDGKFVNRYFFEPPSHKDPVSNRLPVQFNLPIDHILILLYTLSALNQSIALPVFEKRVTHITGEWFCSERDNLIKSSNETDGGRVLNELQMDDILRMFDFNDICYSCYSRWAAPQITVKTEIIDP